MNFVQLKDNDYEGIPFRNAIKKENVETFENIYNTLSPIANNSLNEVISNNKNLLVFPYDLNAAKDKIGESLIIRIQKEEPDISKSKIYTNNLMGFIGIGNTQISITSRFCADDGKDFFLHYMLGKVFDINLFELNFSTKVAGYFDLLYLMFPVLFKKAGKQGIYKEYKSYKRNDSKVKGSIDIKRYINRNIPFNGNIAYNVREYSSDNNVTQLIRHTIEYIKNKAFGTKVLSLDYEMSAIVNQICLYTPSYSKNDRQKIINKNLKLIAHPYYKEYIPLQRLCLQILRNDKICYQEDENKIYGILFDGAWLWEEFLATVLTNYDKSIIHPRNKIGTDGIRLFANGRTNYYPDFRLPTKENKNESDIILDAKYKNLLKKDVDGDFPDAKICLPREDKFQMISYLHVQKASKGIFLYPFRYQNIEDDNDNNKKSQFAFSKSMMLNGFAGEIYSIGFPIIQTAKDLAEYSKHMDEIVGKFSLTKNQ